MDEVRGALLAGGASLIGFADLRGLPEDVREGLPFGVSFAVALNPAIVAGIEAGPTQEYSDEYARVNVLLGQLSEATAERLRERGYRAVGMVAVDTGIDRATFTTRLPHKTVATRAGLGWIGKCALLVTEEFGSALRFATVLTDAPVPVGTPIDSSACGKCTACVDICPGHAPSGRNWEVSLARGDFYDAFACLRAIAHAAGQAGLTNTVCGRCIAACPWTKKHLARALRA